MIGDFKVKICHITSVHPLNDTRIFEKECCSLAKKGNEVYLIGNGKNEIKNGVTIIGIKNPYRGRVRRGLLYSRKVVNEALRLECEVYHLHDPELLFYAKSIKKHGYKVIFDSHEDVPRQILDKGWIPFGLRKVISSIYERYEKSVCKKMNAIVVATEKISEVFKKHNIESTIVYNYPVIKENSIQKDIEKKNNLLCFAGSLFVENGIIQLIDVVYDMPEICLKLAGPIQNEVKGYIENKKTDRIQYLGIITHQEVEILYRESTIGVVADLPTGNNIEGLPIKLFEYMQSGLPVITTNFPLRKKIFEEFECGILINPYDSQQYKEAIQKIISDKKYSRKCIENGKIAIETKYNWKNEEMKLLKLYNKL